MLLVKGAMVIFGAQATLHFELRINCVHGNTAYCAAVWLWFNVLHIFAYQ